MKMQEIEKGIYRYNGELCSCNDNPLILVHPWYNKGNQKFKIHKQNIPYILRARGYLRNLENLLKKSSERNVVLFEEIILANNVPESKKFFKSELLENLENSLKRIINLRGEGGLYGISTYKGSPKPFFNSWESALKFIKSLSNNVELSGGYLNRSRHYDSYTGCAGVVYEKLLKDNFKVKLAKSCCFIS